MLITSQKYVVLCYIDDIKNNIAKVTCYHPTINNISNLFTWCMNMDMEPISQMGIQKQDWFRLYVDLQDENDYNVWISPPIFATYSVFNILQ